MSADDDAFKRVEEFANDGSTGGAWRGIGKDELVNDLHERISNKDGLNQLQAPLCTEASLVHIQLEDDPVSFVNLTVELYKTGRGSWRGRIVTANQELLTKPPPDGSIVNGAAQKYNRADWIVMASIRNTINPADHFNATSRKATYFSELESFIRRLGYTKVEADYSMNSSSKGWDDNVVRANELLRNGYRVLLNINARMLDPEKQSDGGITDFFSKPNHAVQLLSQIRVIQAGAAGVRIDKSGNILFTCNFSPDSLLGYAAVDFDIYTWGDGHYHIPHDVCKPLSVDDFLWNYYGFIAFKN